MKEGWKEGRKENEEKFHKRTTERKETREGKKNLTLLFCARGSKATTTTTMNFVDANKKPTNTGGIDETVKLAGGKLDGLVGMDEDGDMQKDYTWDCVVFGDGSL